MWWHVILLLLVLLHMLKIHMQHRSHDRHLLPMNPGLLRLLRSL
jgi:hypothetical protein